MIVKPNEALQFIYLSFNQGERRGFLKLFFYLNNRNLYLRRRVGRAVDCGSLENC